MNFFFNIKIYVEEGQFSSVVIETLTFLFAVNLVILLLTEWELCE